MRTEPFPPYARLVGPADSQVEVHVNDSGGVVWSSDWTRMDDLARAGYLTRKNYGPATYGHVDYFVPEVTK